MIKRKILSKLQEHLFSDQMTIITGPRQVGKTYLMTQLQKQLQDEGKKTVWLNLDNEEDQKRFSSQANLLAYIELLVGKEKAFVFIDEIQRKENAGLFLKGIFDMNTPYKFVVSGSGSLELKAKISESMAGRKQLFTVNPVSFEEFVNFKTDYQYENKLEDFYKIESEKIIRLLSEYMVFGGYPRVVLADTVGLKQRQMQEIYRSYIDRDIHGLLHLEKTDAFNNLLKILASQIGGLVNVSELALTIGIDQKTIKHYLFYLEQTFLIQKVTPFFRNTRSEVTKAPVYYFIDTGLRNWLLGLFGLPEILPSISGHLFENLIFNMLTNLTEFTSTQIHFWRTKDQAEVDFVLEKGLEVTPIEVKYSKLTKPEIPRSLRSFLIRYKPSNAYIVHIGTEESRDVIEKTTLQLLPFFKLIFHDFEYDTKRP
ncbi:ATPase [Candidatus Amesbacteria bacterium RIFOXYB1_FULL_44_23]|uniref:ATPase n=1 Tax=Candidatus Amesbacteria bacterium RIFOXYB1_FULL_44_23 TaxID=1797263 RepID=A0A1F4ZW50_9BACT|nr:MAG: ATPase [Candidatus Amesbacteria bacterium RIFOXYB1_FULL_44_23]